jgi:uncharacterized protein (TIGR03085 family)
MASPPFDAVERQELCDLLQELGPAAPTLLHPWTTRDLAAHLVLRERDLVAAPGLVLPGAWARLAERRRQDLTATSYDGLVARLRDGPPRGLFRMRPVRRVANLNEFFVHHEDVRRANGGAARALPPGEDDALFRNVASARRLLLLRTRSLGLDIEWMGTDRSIRSRPGLPRVRLLGPPGDLLLYLFGRETSADVEISGSPEALARLQQRRRPWWWGTA